MPVTNIKVDSALSSLETQGLHQVSPSLQEKLHQKIVATPLGLTLVEIQGELSLPKTKPNHLNEREQELFRKNTVPQLLKSIHSLHGDVDTVKFGHLELDTSLNKATLFISTTQRLLGKIEKIDPPLGVLKIQHGPETSSQIIDVINSKVIFKQRPLPIMWQGESPFTLPCSVYLPTNPMVLIFFPPFGTPLLGRLLWVSGPLGSALFRSLDFFLFSMSSGLSNWHGNSTLTGFPLCPCSLWHYNVNNRRLFSLTDGDGHVHNIAWSHLTHSFPHANTYPDHHWPRFVEAYWAIEDSNRRLYK